MSAEGSTHPLSSPVVLGEVELPKLAAETLSMPFWNKGLASGIFRLLLTSGISSMRLGESCDAVLPKTGVIEPEGYEFHDSAVLSGDVDAG